MKVKTYDGIEIYVLPDNACCYASDGCVSPLDLEDCPLGAEVCHPDICGDYHEFYEASAIARFVTDGNYCPNCGAKMDKDSSDEKASY